MNNQADTTHGQEASDDFGVLDLHRWLPRYAPSRLLSNIFLWSSWLGNAHRIRNVGYPSEETTHAVVAFEKIIAESPAFERNNYIRAANDDGEHALLEVEVEQGVEDDDAPTVVRGRGRRSLGAKGGSFRGQSKALYTM
jgi:hypothetical protein